ncbi:MAG: hypothetical protein NZ992_03375 [Candidatus Korarchaeum sp.]|nr:hypothetical protein [Candidatus Korarchaeum sp.]MDW8036401.1 hypothetical protein [Candidatus Korarchaeum sp.]
MLAEELPRSRMRRQNVFMEAKKELQESIERALYGLLAYTEGLRGN